MTPKLAATDLEIEECFDVMAELRPNIVKATFVQHVRAMQLEGYQLVYLKDEGSVVAVAGFRISSNLIMGKNLYVDDLVTSNRSRSKGYGETLMTWVKDLAIRSGCRYWHLDSGTQRGDAHRFYFKQGFTILAYHFAEKLENSQSK